MIRRRTSPCNSCNNMPVDDLLKGLNDRLDKIDSNLCVIKEALYVQTEILDRIVHIMKSKE